MNTYTKFQLIGFRRSFFGELYTLRVFMVTTSASDFKQFVQFYFIKTAFGFAASNNPHFVLTFNYLVQTQINITISVFPVFR